MKSLVGRLLSPAAAMDAAAVVFIATEEVIAPAPNRKRKSVETYTYIYKYVYVYIYIIMCIYILYVYIRRLVGHQDAQDFVSLPVDMLTACL